MFLPLLRERHRLEEGWMVFNEISWGGESRRVDAIAVNVWPSRRHAIAYEFKQSKADFRRELDDPSKREVFASICNEFVFVAPRGIIDVAELPAGCGLLEVVGADAPKLRAARRGKQKKANRLPEGFLFHLLNRHRIQLIGAEHARKQDAWAQLAGKTIDIETLKRLGQRLWEVRHDRYVDSEVRRAVDDDRRKRRDARREEWSNVIDEIKKAARLHRGRLGGRVWGDVSLDEIRAVLADVGRATSVTQAIQELKNCRDRLDSAVRAFVTNEGESA